MLDAIGGRKFLLTLLVLGLGTAVQVLSPKGVTTEYTALLLGVVAAFHGANAMITTKTLSASDDSAQEESVPAPPAVDLTPLHAQLDAQSQALKEASDAVQAHAQVIEGMQKSLELTQLLAKAAIGVNKST